MKFFSLSKFPGKTGEYYYNTLFKRYGIYATYTALECTDIETGVNEMRSIGASGFSVSMPYKNSVMKFIDKLDESVIKYSSCNTVLNKKGKLVGYNTDLAGVMYFSSLAITPVSILGNGSMGTMFSAMVPNAKVYARNLGNWEDRNFITGTVINCTGLGTSTKESPLETLDNINLVLDLAIKENELTDQCKKLGIRYIGGIEFYKRQLLHQFRYYTKLKIKIEELENI